MQQIKRWGHLTDITNEWLGKIASFIIFTMMAIVVMEVILRYGFNRPTVWAWDVNVQLFAAFVFLGAGYTILHRVYVVVDVLYNRFPLRVRAIADLIACICCLVFCVALMLEGGVMTWKSWAVRETSRTFFGPPLYPIKTLLPIGAFLMALQWGVQFIRDFPAAITGKERRPSEH